MLVVIDPDGEPVSQSLQERNRLALVVLSAGKSEVDDGHAPLWRRGWQVAGLLDEEDAHRRNWRFAAPRVKRLCVTMQLPHRCACG